MLCIQRVSVPKVLGGPNSVQAMHNRGNIVFHQSFFHNFKFICALYSMQALII